jgi:hypothetical protein
MCSFEVFNKLREEIGTILKEKRHYDKMNRRIKKRF